MSGLIASAILAGSQYYLYYHQVARPYAWGAFFIALAAYAYFSWFYHKRKNLYLVLFTTGAVLAAYTHYLALLSVLVIGFSALTRDYKKPIPWIIAGLTTLVLFLPHLSIFYAQLQLGGVGQWLSKPDSLWLAKYFEYVFNFAFPFWLIAIGLMFQFYLALRRNFYEGLVWFSLVFLVGYFYSVYRNPVLQYSSLIFICPFLFLLPAAKSEKEKSARLQWLALPFCLLLIWPLFNARQFIGNAHLSPPKETFQYIAENDLKPSAVFYHWSDEKWKFYRQIDPEIPEGTYIQELPKKIPGHDFLLIRDHASSGTWPIEILDKGFQLIERRNYFGFSIDHYSRKNNDRSSVDNVITLIETKSFQSNQAPYFTLDSISGETPLLERPQSILVIDISDWEGPAEHFLAIKIEQDGEQVAWKSFPLKNGKNYFSVPIGQYPLSKTSWKILLDQSVDGQSSNGIIRCRIWPGNPKVYGLVQDFKE